MNEDNQQQQTTRQEHSDTQDTVQKAQEEQNSNQDEQSERIVDLVKVRFWGNPRPHTFEISDSGAIYQDFVIAESDRGLSLGRVNSFVFQKKVKPEVYKKILRKASPEDLELEKEALDKAKEIKKTTSQEIEKLSLDMHLSHVSPIEFGKKFVIYFTAKERVDFRELLKNIRSNEYGIELRHIDLQQKAEALGAIGSCGHASSDFLLTIRNHERKGISINKSFNRI